MEELGFKLNINPGDGEKSVKSIKQELRQATAEAANLAFKFGDTSKEAIEAAKRAAVLGDTIADTNARIQAFSPDEKFKAVSQSLQGVASGYTAIQGVQGLLGADSKELESQLLKVQAALAFSEGINGLLSAKDSFTNLIGVIKNTTLVQKILNTTTTGFGKAMAATGVLLFVSALGYIIANFDSIKASVLKAVPALNNIGGVFAKIKEVAFGVGNTLLQYVITPVKALVKVLQGDFKGAGDALKSGLDVIGNYEKGANTARQQQGEEAAAKRLETQIKEKDKAIEIAKAKGQDTYKLERNSLQLQLKAAKDNATEKEKLNQQIRVLDASHNKAVSDQQNTANKKASDAVKQKRDEEKQKHEQALKDANQILEKYKEDAYQLTLTDIEKALRQIDVKHAEEKQKLINNGKDLTDLNKVITAERAETIKEFEKKAADQIETDKSKNDKIKEDQYTAEIERVKALETSKLIAIQQAQQDKSITEAQAQAQTIQLQKDSLAAQLSLTQKYGFDSLEVQNQILNNNLNAQKTADAQKLADAQSIEDAKYMIASSGLNALSNIVNLSLGEGKRAQGIQKALGAVQIGIDTGLAISSMLKGVEAAAAAGGPAYPFIKVGLYAQGFASILANAAKAKKLLGKSGGDTPTATSSSAPVNPKVPIENNATFLNRSGINNAGQSQTLKAYVTETDVTKVQARIKQIETASKF